MGHIQLLPWFDEDTTDIESIFVAPEVTKLINTPSRRIEKELESYDMIVAMETNVGQRVCRVLVRGKAGSGKSTLISKLVHDWALRVGRLGEYQLVFALNLREAHPRDSLVEMIFDQILPGDTVISKAALESYVQSHADQVLLLLDGYDEYPMAQNLNQWSSSSSSGDQSHDQSRDMMDILCVEKLRECCVIVTTRPHKVEDFGQYHRWYSQVQLNGFSSDGIDRYVVKFFEDSPEMAAALKSKLNQSRPFTDLSHIPIVLLMFCLLWNDSQCLPERLTDLFRQAFHYLVKRYMNQAGFPIDDDGAIDSEVNTLIQDVGERALKGLLEPGAKLVFNEHDFAPGVVDKACKVGLLSRERTRSKLTIKRSTTFFHKTFQEFSAGSYLASLAETKEEDFLSYLSQIKTERLDEHEYLLRFCCGYSRASAKLVLPYVAQLRGELGDDSTAGLDSMSYSIAIRLEHGLKQTWMLPVILLQESQQPDLVSEIASVFKSTLPNYLIAEHDPESKQALEYLLQCNASLVSQTAKSDDQRKIKSVFHNIKQVQLVAHHCQDIDLMCRHLQGLPNLVTLKLVLLIYDYPSQDPKAIGRYLKMLSDAIGTMKLLQTLCIYSVLHRIDITPILSRLCHGTDETTTAIARLAIHGCTFDMETMSRFLQTRCKLHTLHLYQNNLKASDVATIAKSIVDHRELEEVLISQNEVGDSLSCLQDIMSQLKVLKLKSAGLSKAHATALSDLLNSADHLETFDFGDNPIQSDLLSVFETLPDGSLPCIKDISLSSHKDVTVSSVLPFLSRSLSRLQALDLSGIRIGPSQGKLTQILANKTDLANLNLSQTNLQYPDFIELVECFPQLPALTHLNLVDNDPGPKALEAIFRGFGNNLPVLKEVKLSNGCIHPFSIRDCTPFLMTCLDCLVTGPVRGCFRLEVEAIKRQDLSTLPHKLTIHGSEPQDVKSFPLMLTNVNAMEIDALRRLVREEESTDD